jgi:hypothetical protein
VQLSESVFNIRWQNQRLQWDGRVQILERTRLFLFGTPEGMGTERNLVKVATFNINNINKRLDNLLAWLTKAEPDVVSLQELKAEQEAFPVNALRTLGYEAVWQGERSQPSSQLEITWQRR